MDRKKCKELLDAGILQAWSEGRTVQCCIPSEDDWFDDEFPDFKDRYNYRIKPEPREFYVVTTGAHKNWAFDNFCKAMDYCKDFDHSGVKIIKVCEVIE